MNDHDGFDPYTSPFDRSPDELWLPYAIPAHRVMRDAVYGATPEIFARCSAQLRMPRHPRKPTKYISRMQISRVFTAVRFANYQGCILNVEISLSFKFAGVATALEAQTLYNKIMDRFKKYMKNKGLPAFYYGVFENGSNVGLHFHGALHVPHIMRKEIQCWWDKILGELAVDGQSRNFGHMVIHKDKEFLAQWKWFRYCMKGLNPWLTSRERNRGYADLNSLTGVRREETGLVDIDRVRIARCLGEKAQNDAGYRPGPAMGAMPHEQRYTGSEYYRRNAEELTRLIQGMDLI